MAEVATKLPVKTEKKAAEPTSATQAWWPVEGLRREIDRLFDDFGMRSWSSLPPFDFRGRAILPARIELDRRARRRHHRKRQGL